MAKVGRPSDFKEEYVEQAYNYALLGATDVQMASFFDTTEQTLNNWKKSFPEFFESIKKGKALADAKVAESLYHRANGYSHPETKVFNNQGEIVTFDVTKQYAPDPTAAIFWLKNRQPELWRDRQENVNQNVEMTQEEWLNSLK